MKKRIFIDLDICDKCPECVIKCSYFYHPTNNGILTIREIATYLVTCRKCELGTCTKACRYDALVKEPDQPLKRYNFRCVSCKSCTLACPFGTIYPDIVGYLQQGCDFSEGRVAKGDVPLCVKTCPYDALKYGEFEEKPEENIYLAGDHLAVRTTHWVRDWNVIEKEREKAKKKK